MNKFTVYTVSNKKGDTKLIGITSSNLNRFSKFFFTDKFSRKFTLKQLLKSHQTFYTSFALLCKTSISENKRHSQTKLIINKSQGSVATHLRCGKFLITIFFYKFIAESASVKIFKLVNIWQNCRQEGGLHVDREQKQFPVTLMTHMRISHGNKTRRRLTSCITSMTVERVVAECKKFITHWSL